MRKVFVFAVLLEILFLAQLGLSLDRQPNADYRARRQALASKTNGGVVLLFAPTEAEGPNAIYGYRPDSDFFYLSGWTEPGAALLIAPAVEAKGNDPARAYTEILFLPAHNYVQEKWTGPKLGPENPQASSITGFDHVEVLDSMRDELVRLLPQPRATIYTDVPGRRRNLELQNANGMAEPRQRISPGTLSSGRSSACGLTAHLQRCGRNRSNPQSSQRLHRRPCRRHA